MRTLFPAIVAAVLAVAPFSTQAQDQQPAGDQQFGRGDPTIPSGENQGASLVPSDVSQPDGRSSTEITGPGPSDSAPAAAPEIEQDFGRGSPMPVEGNQ